MNKYERWQAVNKDVSIIPLASHSRWVDTRRRYMSVVAEGAIGPGNIEGYLRPVSGTIYGCNGLAVWDLAGFWFTESGRHINYDWYLVAI